MSTATEKQSVYFKRWYLKNREKLSEQRKAKYQSDPEYRENIQKREQKQRRTRTAPVEDMRLNAQMRPSYRISAVAERVGCTASRIKNWERNGWIPPVTETPNEHRYYEPHQMALIQKVFNYLEVEGNSSRDAAFSSVLRQVRNEWEI